MMRSHARWIAGIWKPYPWRLLLILTLTVVSMVSYVTLPLILKGIFDGLVQDLPVRSLSRSVGLYLALGTLAWATAALLMIARGLMNIRFEWVARQRAWSRLVHLSRAFFHRFRTGDLVTRLTDDVAEKMSWFLCSGIFRTVAALILIGFSVGMMIRLDPWLTLFTAGPLPVLIFLFIRTGSVLERRFDAVQARISDMNDGLEATFSGVRVVKAYGRENMQESAFLRTALACRTAEIDAAKSRTLIEAMYGQVWQLGVIAVLLAGGIAVMNGRLTIGTFVAFEAYVLLLIIPMFDIGTFFVNGMRASVSITRLREIEDAPPEIASPGSPDHHSLDSIRGHVVFESVSYSHAPANQIGALEGVSLEVRPGEMVAVVGAVGSGKSVLLGLLPRLADPDAGRVMLDGTDVRRLPLELLRRAVGWVPQEAVLFSQTISENIRFGRDWVDEAAIARAARTARLGHDLRELPRGLDTLVGVRGVSLSGGQKQRVALARALAGAPRVLVLDDATAALDAETESELWSELHRLLPDLSTIVVTHRTATLEAADRIIVLANGRVVETGTHPDLTERGGVYAALYRRHRLEERAG